VYLVIKSLIRSDNLTFSIAAIRVPEPVAQSANRHATPAKGLFKDDLEKIRTFGAYIDSLATGTSERRIYDSILKYRHRLIDSLSITENFHKWQSSNK
jgi:hypothetical protein